MTRTLFLDRETRSAAGIHWDMAWVGPREAPVVLALHGTGATSHSFEPLCAAMPGFRWLVLDLPGHGGTRVAEGASVDPEAIASSLRSLLLDMAIEPSLAIGHSAGAALLFCWALGRGAPKTRLVGLATAAVPLPPIAERLLPVSAALLGRSRRVVRALSEQAKAPGVVEGLLASVGAHLDEEGAAAYRRAASDPAHLHGVLRLLSSFRIRRLYERLPLLDAPILLLAGDRDRATPLGQQFRLVARLPRAELRVLRGTGHLLHEERPEEVARQIERWLEA